MSVNARKMGTGIFFVVLMTQNLLSVQAKQDGSTGGKYPRPPFFCDPALTALFTPPRPQLGRYEVCTTPEALPAVAPPDWKVEAVAPADAFGAAGRYDRAALARLYGGRRPLVARGWTEQRGQLEAVTLISPYPDRTLTRLLPGTLLIKHVIIR